MNPLLKELLDEKRTLLESGDYVEMTSHIDHECGLLLQKAIRDLRPKMALEVGLAYGMSTLYILEALEENGGQKLIGMDPAQHDGYWRGGGLHNIRRAGYGHLYEFHENTSQQILPKLAGEGQRIDFAFIDGWHTFDHALVDFFYIDQMLNIGGIVVFDDVGYPSIRRLCEFVVTNRDYLFYDAVRRDMGNSLNRTIKKYFRNALRPLWRTDKTPTSESSEKIVRISDAYFLALTKTGDDKRRWDHFVQF